MHIDSWIHLQTQAVFLVSNDSEFALEPKRTRSGINYPALFRHYKQRVMELQETKPDRFQDLVDYYSRIVFDQGVKEVLRRHTLNDGDYSMSDIDWDTSSELSDEEQHDIGEEIAPVGTQPYSFENK